MPQSWDDFLASIWPRVFSAVLVVLGVVTIWLAPSFEERFFPVIEPGSSRIIDHRMEDDGWLTFHVTFHKRYNCRSIAEATEWFYTDKAGDVGPLPFRTAANIHSPSGIVVSPALQVLLPDEATGFFGRVTYDCSLPWKVYATIGPFSLPL